MPILVNAAQFYITLQISQIYTRVIHSGIVHHDIESEK